MLIEEEESSMKSPCKNRIKLSTLIGTILYYISLSVSGPLSAFAPYLVSYLHKYNTNLTIHYSYFISPILFVSNILFAPFGGFTDRLLGAHLSIIIGTVIRCLGAFLCVFSKNLYLDYCLVVLYGLGGAVSTGSVMKNVFFYYPKNRGLIMGLNMFFSSLGGALFVLIGEMIINPHSAQVDENKMYPFEVSKRITLFFWFQILLTAVFSILSVVFIYTYKKEYVEEEEQKVGMDKLEKNEENTEANEESSKDFNIHQVKDILKSWRFLRFCIILFCTSFIYFLLQTTNRVIGMSINIKTIYLQILGILSLVILCIFTPLWGLVTDRISFKYLLLGFNIGTTIISISYYYCLKLTATYFMMTLFVSFMGAGLSVILIPHLIKVYGMKYIIEISGVMMISTGVSYGLSSGFAFIVQTYTSNPNLSYQIMFWLAGGLGGLSAFLGLFEDDCKFNE